MPVEGTRTCEPKDLRGGHPAASRSKPIVPAFFAAATMRLQESGYKGLIELLGL
jgi:hypothetical protein